MDAGAATKERSEVAARIATHSRQLNLAMRDAAAMRLQVQVSTTSFHQMGMRDPVLQLDVRVLQDVAVEPS